MYVFSLLQIKLYVLLMFLAFYFSGASTNHGANSLMPIFACSASLHSSLVVCSSSVVFVSSFAVIFSEK